MPELGSISQTITEAYEVLDKSDLDPDAQMVMSSLMAELSMMRSDLLWAYSTLDAALEDPNLHASIKQQAKGFIDHYERAYE